MIFTVILTKSVTAAPNTVLIRMKTFKYVKKGSGSLDDSKIVALYLIRDETAIKQTSEK